MKKKLIAFAISFVLCVSILPALAQTQDSTLVEMYLLDFSVPDMPAFKALGTDPSNLLRPGDPKKFAATLSPFFSNGQGVIPKNFAVEFSPWKLASSNWTLSEYNSQPAKRFLYNSSFSIGTVTDSTEYSNKVAVGYRVSFLSRKADIYRNAEIRQYIYGRQAQAMQTYVDLTNYWVVSVINPPIADRPTYYATHVQDFNEFLSDLEASLQATPNAALQQLYDNFINAISGSGTPYTAEQLKDVIQAYGADVDEFIAKYKAENWNASRLDFAMAYVAQSNDDLISNAQFSSFSTWLTGALRVHRGGQLLVGANVVLPRSVNDSSRVNFSGNLRYYVGTQHFRGFLESQYKFEKYEPVEKTVLINLGTEFRIGNRFWVVASVGLNNYLTEKDPVNKLISSIDLRYGFNGSN